MPVTDKDIVARLGPGSWPSIISNVIDTEHAEFRLHIPTDLVEFAGHFPQQAVVPGVLQVHWAVKLAQVCFQNPPMTASFSALQGIKFNAMVLPETYINLSLQLLAAEQRLRFAFYEGDSKFSSGVLRFANDGL